MNHYGIMRHRKYHDFDVGIGLFEGLREFQARHVRHTQIRHDNINDLCWQDFANSLSSVILATTLKVGSCESTSATPSTKIWWSFITAIF